MKLTRRMLGRTLFAGLAGAGLEAQAPPQAPAETELAQARAQLRTAAQIVRAVPLPLSTEPATRFQPRT